nr:MAG TPA: hypothetical protein [Caudoviricetes sp.]
MNFSAKAFASTSSLLPSPGVGFSFCSSPVKSSRATPK